MVVLKISNHVGCFTRSLAVEDFRGKEAASSFLCDVGIVQLTETTDCRQEQVPQACLPGFHLEPYRYAWYNTQCTCKLNVFFQSRCL